MAQSFTVRVSGGLGKALESAPEAFKRKRSAILAKVKPQLRQIVNSSITGSGLRDDHGKIRGWQRQHEGAGGGYAAYRPISARDVGGGAAAAKRLVGANSPGAITNYLESGHKLRFPSGKSERYRPEVHMARAKAYRFYAGTAPDIDRIEAEMRQEMEQFCKQLLEEG